MYTVIIRKSGKEYMVEISTMVMSAQDWAEYGYKKGDISFLTNGNHFSIGNITPGKLELYCEIGNKYKPNDTHKFVKYEFPEDGYSNYNQEDDILKWVDELNA